MGSILKPICSCGAPFKQLYIGGGKMNFMTVCDVPGICMNCGTIIETNILDNHHPCHKCKEEMTLIGKIMSFGKPTRYKYNRPYFLFEWHIKLDESYVLESKFYTCPICKEETLKFEGQGCWD